MITHLHVERFQSIVEADLALGPLTLICGPNFSGKSALLRALHALCFNRTGEDFIQQGADAAFVAIEDDEGHIVSWEKPRGSSASYTIAGRLGRTVLPGKKFEKTGAKPPDEVTELLGVGAIEIDKDFTVTPQFQMQWDRPLLTASGSKMARLLGLLTKLDRIVRAQMHSRKDRDRQQREQTTQERFVEEHGATLTTLDWTGDVRMAVDHLKGVLQVAEATQDALDLARRLSNEFSEARAVITQGADNALLQASLQKAQAGLEGLVPARNLVQSYQEARLAHESAEQCLNDAREELAQRKEAFDAACEAQSICSSCPLRM